MAGTQVPVKDVELSPEIGQVLLQDGGSVDINAALTYFKAAAKTNVWSFRKPYNFKGVVGKLTDEQIRSIDCGLSWRNAQVGAPNGIKGKMDGDMNYWEYDRPIGTEESPFRNGDYAGYHPDAPPMIQGFFVPNEASNETSGVFVSATAVVTKSVGYNVVLADVGNFENAYAGVYLEHENDSSIYRIYKNEDVALKEGSFNVDIPAYDLNPTGKWNVYPFMILNGAYFTIPNVQPSSINIVSTLFSCNVMPTKRTDGTQAIDYTIRVHSATSSVTWTNNVWKLRFNKRGYEGASQTYEMEGTLPSPQTINGNGTTVITGTIYNVNDVLWAETTLVLWVGFQSSAYKWSGTVLSQRE